MLYLRMLVYTLSQSTSIYSISEYTYSLVPRAQRNGKCSQNYVIL